MKLTRCRILGRYINPDTGRPVNVHRGTRASRGDDWYFYLYMGKRHFIPEGDFRSNWKQAPFKF
jgi:hypothetical protein